MQTNATVRMLYDTLDSLVALKLDLALSERQSPGLAPARRQRMSADIDQSIDNLRAVLARLETPGARKREVPTTPGD